MSAPLYSGRNLRPAYLLRYSWTAFPSGHGVFPDPSPGLLNGGLCSAWEEDGLRLLEHRWNTDQIQLTFSTPPSVAPAFLSARAKGRLDHALRSAGIAVAFARNFSVRALGDNTRKVVERYVDEQTTRGSFADPRYREELESSAWVDPQVDLRQPAKSKRGLYWYGLHVVLLTAGRRRIDGRSTARVVAQGCREVAKNLRLQIARMAVMPDHLHLALQGNPQRSPEEIALAFQNHLAGALGGIRLWEPNYYVGTFGEYTMHAVR